MSEMGETERFNKSRLLSLMRVPRVKSGTRGRKTFGALAKL